MPLMCKFFSHLLYDGDDSMSLGDMLIVEGFEMGICTLN